MPSWRPSPLMRIFAGLHVAGAAAMVAAPAQWPLVTGVLLANHAALGALSCWPRGSLLGPNLSRLPEDAARAGKIALTFDDGPDPLVTPRVLDLLESHAAPATFFFIGNRVEEHPEIVAETVRRGHRVENHTYRHANSFAFNGPSALEREIDLAQDLLARVCGRRPAWFRAPAGMRNPWLDWVLTRCRLSLVSWTRRGFDAVDRRPERVAGRLLKDLAAGDVLLLHDGSAAVDRRGRPVVLEVLPRLLDAIAEQSLVPSFLPSTGSTRTPLPRL